MNTALGTLRGGLTLLLFSLNTIFWTLPLILSQLLKVLFPNRAWRAFWSRRQNGIATQWISINGLVLGMLNPTDFRVEGGEGLSRNAWYFMLANHQSWVDILALQRVFNRKAPFIKYVLKRELFWVPFLGFAWWALDYPFLERSVRSADRDLERILRSAERFKMMPVTVMIFPEGTRFSPEKQKAQRSPYTHLLKPKAGGLTFLLSAMGDQVKTILDVTIAYPGGRPTFWEFLAGGIPEILVRVRTIPVDPWLLGDYARDKAFRRELTRWLGELWREKDQEMARLLKGESGEARA